MVNGFKVVSVVGAVLGSTHVTDGNELTPPALYYK
jgi:hypothetical protein